MKLIDDVRVDGSFSFVYSARPGTPAADLAGQVPHEVKQVRLVKLQAAIDALYQSASEAMVGTRQRVLVTGTSSKNGSELAARTANNRVVNFAGDTALVGSYADVVITRAYPHSLRGALEPSNGFPSAAPSAHNATNQAA